MIGRPTKCPHCGYIDWAAAPETQKVWNVILFAAAFDVRTICQKLGKKKQVVTHQLRALEKLGLISLVKVKAGRHTILTVRVLSQHEREDT